VDHRVTELAMRRGRHAPAQRVRHQLHAVADAEHGHAQAHHAGIALRRTGFRHALRAAGEDDAGGPASLERLERRVERQNLAVDGQLAQAPRDQLGELRAEIENENRLMWHVADSDE
jgi:hypothetical protein